MSKDMLQLATCTAHEELKRAKKKDWGGVLKKTGVE